MTDPRDPEAGGEHTLPDSDQTQPMQTDALAAVHRDDERSRGKRLTGFMRGRATTGVGTDEVMALSRSE